MNFAKSPDAKSLFATAAFFCFSLFVVLPVVMRKASAEPAAQESGALAETGFAIFPGLDMEESLASTQAIDDITLHLLRLPQTRASVEWFFIQLVNDRDIALAILDAAEEYDVPVSLAFSVAYAESKFTPGARHVNKNGSIDRGLFQLNDRSFPSLTEAEFFDAKTSARYGMSHLRFCMDTAGNDVAAIAMYNAGTNKVDSNRTPKTTLDYIAKVQDYRAAVDRSFEAEVLSFYVANASSAYEKDASLLAKR